MAGLVERTPESVDWPASYDGFGMLWDLEFLPSDGASIYASYLQSAGDSTAAAMGDFAQPALGPNAGLSLAGCSTVGGAGIVHQHGFGPLQGHGSADESPAGGITAVADMAISHCEVGSNMAWANGQPDLAAGGLTQLLPHSCPAQPPYGVDGKGEELNSASSYVIAAAPALTQPAATDTGNPSVQEVTAWEFLSMLQEARDCWPGLSRQQKRDKYPMILDLVDKMPDPWVSLKDHPEGFITKASNKKETRMGSWKERHFKAIRSRSAPEQHRQPQYIGAQKTYEFHFHKHNGKATKNKWLMHEYHLLDPHDDHQGLVLDEDGPVYVVILPATDEEDEAGVSEEYQSPPKRRRSSAPNGESDVWQHFTKIYSKAGKLAYAACHDCDMIFGARNGTSSLRRHNKTHLQPRS